MVYSCTKHIDGQGRVLGGAVLGSRKWINDTLQPFIRNTGPAMSPFNAWVLLKGLETLALRVDAGCRAAAAIADFLAEQPEVTRVWYPTRADHPQQALALQQMTARRHGRDVRGRRRQGRGVQRDECFRTDRGVEQSGRFEVARDASRDHDAYAHRRGGTRASSASPTVSSACPSAWRMSRT